MKRLRRGAAHSSFVLAPLVTVVVTGEGHQAARGNGRGRQGRKSNGTEIDEVPSVTNKRCPSEAKAY